MAALVQNALTKKNVCTDSATIKRLKPILLQTSLNGYESTRPKPKLILRYLR